MPPTAGGTLDAKHERLTRSRPLISERYLDIPSQRMYYLGFGVVCQAIKVLDLVWLAAPGIDRSSVCRKWLFVDLAYCVLLAGLRIPRLNYTKTTVLLQICLLWFLDGLLFGGISINTPAILGGTGNAFVLGFSKGPEIPTTTAESFNLLDIITPLGFGFLTSSKDAHLLGQHTVRMSPISTAQLNPKGGAFCLPSTSSTVLLPVVLNNTNLAGLRYSITPIGPTTNDPHNKIEFIDLSARELKAIEQAHFESLQLTRPSASPVQNSDDEYDEYDDDDTSSEGAHTPSSLQKTQTLIHLRLSKPGIVRLERVVDTSNVEARLTPSQVVLAPCPRVAFIDEGESASENIRCMGQEPDSKLMIDVFGVPPLSLRWIKAVNGQREQYLVEGIEGDYSDNRSMPQEMRIPLMVSLDQPGTYLYALEEISDGIGNVIRVGSDVHVAEHPPSSKTETTRSFVVLRKPAVTFEHCNSHTPTSLLIGSEAALTVRTVQADTFDAPWEVTVKYQPPTDVGSSNANASKLYKPWKKVLKTHDTNKELTLRAHAPGDYTITGIKGKWCSGDVLAPESCKVMEKPFPSAEIQWKRIHECSSDTGVSAALILRGTPPFQVYYRMQRDNEPTREFSKTFATSRGEVTLQPDRSGHYTFTFTSLSDSNYRKVELEGPSIDQLIHPLASADFSENHGGPRTKRKISTCSGDTVDIDVDLKGTGPWNVEMQIIGPSSSDTLPILGIESSRKQIRIPIPESVKRNGGTFEIDLISVEDAYKCKRSISVPGVIVSVKRVRPTVQFYGAESERHITVTEHERASLPLRLTGDGPWHIKYRRTDTPHKILTIVLNNPNDHIEVTEKGVYEIIGITDSQCPGSVIAHGSTYKVGWIARPSAQLSPSTNAIHESHNGSYILKPICEGSSDHVDLILTGRPPFQIQYNVAQNSDMGGTKLISQPTFNSIQPHTRFQLQTSSPGRMYYEVKQVGDAAYPLAKHKSMVIPRSERLLFEQQVSMRPSARFKNRNRMTYCLNDMFTSLDASSGDGVIMLDGTPPFILTLTIKDLAASQVDKKAVEILENVWKVDLPSYTFRSIGPHLVGIESVSDSSSCAQTDLDPLYSSVWVDVAETAAIIPFDRREDICVGEVSQFQLEGIPPWTIGYRVNGRSHIEEARVSPFSILQQQAGKFTVTSIAHQQKMCKAVVADLNFEVHDLPSAQVGRGKRIFQDIHEGDQAEIVFTLIGEPPFTFTYQRSEPSPKKGGKPGKVLETHTVSRVMTNEYSIFSALEGTWAVTSISDRYCRYPPVQPELAVEKQKQKQR
ncbi:hypothetical protein BDQ12DRAFT_234110 [Crucibulum laeve]|uniref:Nucleoporin Pom152 n=1 Tax=Crucibulum laeve TaxID=68775 RepID=A0A5C3LYP3_9AGAR|nr:hypothetical protein BDQ12DRAFT_234110 [Crucibulum laeve]